MNRNDIVDRCESRYRDTANAIVTATEWADYVNDAYLDVLTAAAAWEPPAPFLESRATNTMTTTGQLTLPTDCWRVLSVFDTTNKNPLPRLDGRSSHRLWYPEADTTTGTPEVYRLRANVLELYPHPSSSVGLSVDYLVAPSALGATDEPIFAEHYHRMLIAGALAYAYEDDGDAKMADRAAARFQSALAQMRLDLTSSRGDTYTEVLDTGL